MEEFQHVLLDAILAGNTEAVSNILKDHHEDAFDLVSDPDVSGGRYLLHEACILGFEDIVLYLIAYHRDINQLSPSGSALYLACQYGYYGIVALLLCNKAVVPEPCGVQQGCPFYIAAFSGWVEILEALLCARTSSENEKFVSRWCLEAAVDGGHIDVTKVCFRNYHRVHSSSEIQEDLSNMLQIACKGGHDYVVQFLISCGAELTPDIVHVYEETILNALLLDVVTVDEDEDLVLPGNSNTQEEMITTHLRARWSHRSIHTLSCSWMTWLMMDRLSELDLSNNKLTSIPESLPWGLEHLTLLNISHNQLTDIPKPARINCLSLTTLIATHNILRSIPEEIFYINTLLSLDVSHNQLDSLVDLRTSRGSVQYADQPQLGGQYEVQIDFDRVWSCLALQKLDVSHNHLKALPHQIQMCGRLVILRVGNNSVRNFMPSWCCPLEILDLANNQLTDLPDLLELNWENSLMSLLLSGNRFSTVPHTICKLKNLVTLDMSHNELAEFPPPTVWCCSQLTELDLSHNKLCYEDTSRKLSLPRMLSAADLDKNIEFPEVIANTLTDLDLSHNSLRDVPLTICKLKNLQRLELNSNPDLHVLPPELGFLSECFDLKIDAANITNLPKSLLTEPIRTRSVLAHLKHLLQKAVPYCGMKLVILGPQGVGKSLLSTVLQKKSQSPAKNSRMVTIEQWNISGWSMRKLVKAPLGGQGKLQDLQFQVWDFSGQGDLSTIHKLFLSSCSLYLVLFDLRLQREGINTLKHWLLDIEAHAAKSHVIIIGTFLDYLNEDGRAQLPNVFAEIIERYRPANGYPHIDKMMAVSCLTKENIQGLKEVIYQTATGLKYRGKAGTSKPSELIVGRKVSQSYLNLGQALKLESIACKRKDRIPVLTVQEVFEVAQSLPDNDISTLEELQIATNFLHEAGFLLHYSSSLRGLDKLFFLDPCWLVDNLAQLLDENNVRSCLSGGVLDLAQAQALLFTEATFRTAKLGQYVDLLEKFEIALLMNKDKLLIPSKIQNICPQSVQMSLHSNEYKLMYRVYNMRCTPSGFWPRVITQFITMLQRVCLQPINFPAEIQSANERRMEPTWDCLRMSYTSLPLANNRVRVTYWQQGIAMDYSEGVLVVESSEQASMSWGLKESGIIITLATQSTTNAAVLGFAADQIEYLIQQWFSGLVDESNPIKRLAPCPECIDLIRRGTHQSIHMFDVHDCVIEYINENNVRYNCPKCQHEIETATLIPDFSITDVPAHLHKDRSEIICEDEPTILGRGGEGQVYQGIFNGSFVAIKESAIIDTIRRLKSRMTGPTSSVESHDQFVSQSGASMYPHVSSSLETEASSLDSSKWIWQFKMIPACQDYRKEVSLLSRLNHPCVVSLLGIIPASLSYIMELAPLGSLHAVISQQHKERAERYPLSSKSMSREMLFDRALTCKIIYQIASALQYLHSSQVVYKDLKPQNVLIWSLHPESRIIAKLSDYGLSSYLSPQGIRGCEGTLGYQAPEMRLGTSYNEKVDMFALSMVIYQVMTGLQLFSNLPSVLIPKLIHSGKRPTLDDAQVSHDLPKMADLMETCWSPDPDDRPMAAEITSLMRDPSFSMLRYTIPMEQTEICAVNYNMDENSDDPNFYYICAPGETDPNIFGIINTSQGHFKVKQPLCKVRATCMAYIGQVTIVGTEDNKVRVYRSERATRRQLEVCEPITTKDTPLCILHKNSQDLDRTHAFEKAFFVSFADGSLNRYQLGMTTKVKADVSLVMEKKFEPENFPIRCMIFMEDKHSIWLGFGPNILVVDSESLVVLHQVTIWEGAGMKDLPISQICCHGDQVWCFRRGSWDVVEIDVGTMSRVCSFDCSMGSMTGVVSITWHDSTETKPSQVWNNPGKSNFNSRLSLRSNSFSVSANTKPATSHIRYSDQRLSDTRSMSKMQALRRKLSFRGKNSSVISRKHRHPLYQIRSLCYVDGAIWVGRKSGDILVMNVTANTLYGYKYGEVIAVLCNQYLNGYANGSVESLIATKDRIVSVRSLNGENKTDKRSEIVIWSASGLEDIHQTQKYWDLS